MAFEQKTWRYLVISAWICCLFSFILGLTTLLAGSTGSGISGHVMDGYYILRYDYSAAASNATEIVKAVVPSASTSTTSAPNLLSSDGSCGPTVSCHPGFCCTGWNYCSPKGSTECISTAKGTVTGQENNTLGKPINPNFKSDGGSATLHLLSVCVSSNSTASPICYATTSGTVYANGTTLRMDGQGSPFEPTGTAMIFGLSVQIGATGIALFGLPWLFKGKWKRQGNWLYLLLLWCGFVGGFIATVAGSNYAFGQSGSNPGGEHDSTGNAIEYAVSYSKGWMAMLWFGMIFTAFAIFFEHAETNFERFTKKDEEVDSERKPKDVRWWVCSPPLWSLFWLKRGGTKSEGGSCRPDWDDANDGKHMFGRL